MIDPDFRDFKLFGAAFSDTGSLNLRVEFAKRLMFDGMITTDKKLSDVKKTQDYYSIRQEICDFQADYSLEGLVPLSISVQGGVLMFGNITANYTLGYLDEQKYINPRVLFQPLCWPGDFKHNICIAGKKRLDPRGDHELYYEINNCAFSCDVYLDPLRRTIFPYVLVWGTRMGIPDPFPINFQ
jgi:hypothetical protein